MYRAVYITKTQETFSKNFDKKSDADEFILQAIEIKGFKTAIIRNQATGEREIIRK